MGIFDAIFGGGGDDGSQQLVRDQKKAAVQARLDEDLRQSRIRDALAGINKAYDGTPTITGYTPGTASWQSLAGAVPSFFQQGAQLQGLYSTYATGQKLGYQLNPTQKINDWLTANLPDQIKNAGLGVKFGAPTQQNRGGSYQIIGPDGRPVYSANSFDALGQWNGNVATKTPQFGTPTGGLGDAFYQAYGDAYKGYYMPQQDEQFSDAQDEMTFRLARHGLLRSTMAGDQMADLARQDALGRASINQEADRSVGDLRSRVNQEKSQAITQAYAVEDPNVAVSQALNNVSNLRTSKPEYSPLGEVFRLAAVGGAAGLQGYRNNQLYGPGSNSPFRSQGYQVR